MMEREWSELRRPSSAAEKWLWWEAAVAGEPVEIHEQDPQVGFYKLRKWPRLDYWLPAQIWIVSPDIDPETGELTDDEIICCEIDGQRASAFGRWTWLAGHPITEEEFKWLTALSPLLPTKPPKK